MKLSRRAFALSLSPALLIACSTAAASVNGPRVLYSSIDSSPTSQVPGGPPILKFISFDRPMGSPSGARWISLARTNTGSTANDAVYITGQGESAVLRIQEGLTEIEPGRVTENVSDRRVAILDDGRYAIATNLTGATTDDQIAILGENDTFTIRFREGQAISAPFSSITGTPAWGAAFGDIQLARDGTIAVRATSIAGLASTANAALLTSDGTALHSQRGATLHTNQAGTPQTVNTYSFGSFYQDRDGNNWLVKADLSGPAATNQVVIVSSAVVLQEGTTIPGFASPITNIISQNMTHHGDWFARGENADDQPWIVRNGVVVARSGDPVPGGRPGELWSNVPWNVLNGNTFGLHTGNRFGDFVLGGFTDTPDADSQYAVVLNNSRVVLREGDPVDLNGDGLFNDDVFFDVTGLNAASLNNKVENGFLTDDGWLYLSVDLRNAALQPIGEAIIRTRAFFPGDWDRSGAANSGDVTAFLSDWFADLAGSSLRSDFNDDGLVNSADVTAFLSAWFCSIAGNC